MSDLSSTPVVQESSDATLLVDCITYQRVETLTASDGIRTRVPSHHRQMAGLSDLRDFPEFRDFRVDIWTSRYYAKKLLFLIWVGGG